MRRTAIEVMLGHGASAAAVAQLVMDVAEPGDVAGRARACCSAGQRSDAASVTAGLERAASANPGFPGLPAAALHARALCDDDLERARAAVRAYSADPRSLVRAAALEDAGRLLPEPAKDEAVAYLDEALGCSPLRAPNGMRRVSAVCSRPRCAACRRAPGPGRGAVAGADRLRARRRPAGHPGRDRPRGRPAALISAHTVNSHLRHVFAKLGIRSRVELARLAGERQPGSQSPGWRSNAGFAYTRSHGVIVCCLIMPPRVYGSASARFRVMPISPAS